MTTPTEQPHLTELAIRALAALTAQLRPGWEPAGIAANLRHIADHTAGPALAIAMIRGSQDPANRTPAFIRHPNNRAFTADWCPIHGNTPRRTDGECGPCYSERVAAPRDTTTNPATPRRRPLEDALARIERPATPDDATVEAP